MNELANIASVKQQLLCTHCGCKLHVYSSRIVHGEWYCEACYRVMFPERYAQNEKWEKGDRST